MSSLPCPTTPRNSTLPFTLAESPCVPEAPLSMNVYVHVPGLPERIQVTARSTHASDSPADVAAQLKAAMDAVQAAFAPPPPVSREALLAGLLIKGLTCATAREDWALVERLGKAAALVLASAVAPGNRTGLMTVRSQTVPETWYDIEEGRCTCQDYAQHAKAGTPRPCKHALAVAFVARIGASYWM